MAKRFELRLADIRNCLAHIEQWCRLLKDAVEVYDPDTGKAVLWSTADDGVIKPRFRCVAPVRDEWSKKPPKEAVPAGGVPVVAAKRRTRAKVK
jgi:hypothetical protein